MFHYGNEYYILVGFCVKKAHVIILILILSAFLLFPIHMVILNLLVILKLLTDRKKSQGYSRHIIFKKFYT